MTRIIKNTLIIIGYLAACVSLAAVCLVAFLGFAVMVGG